MSMLGDLGEVRVGDVLRLLATGKKSGLLTLSDGGQQAAVRFQKGALVHAVSGRLQGDDAVLDLFGWKQGQLTFVPDDRPVPPNVTRTVDTLILEGLRVGEGVHRMAALIPSDRVAFQLTAGPSDPQARVSVGAAEWRVIRQLDGVRNVAEVVEAARLPRAEVARILFDLAEAGFLERVEAQKSLRVQAQGLFGKEAVEIDERVATDWTKISRFAGGVARVELRTLGGRVAVAPVSFRAGLLRDVALPRPLLATLNAREGEDVWVRPSS